jgi:flagellar protein FliS
MSTPGTPSQEYLKSAVLTASPEQLQLMLYDGAIRFATRGLEAIQNQDREAAFNALDRAQRIVLELSNGLRREVNPDLADQMAALYNFVFNRLVEANINQEEQPIHDALRILRHQRETWILLMEKLRRELYPTAGPEGPEQVTPANPPKPPKPSRFQTETPGSSFVAEG